MNPALEPIPMDAAEVRRQLRDHEERLRSLEKERVTDRRLGALEQRVRALELTAAKAVVVVGAVAFIASAAASALVSLAVQALAGG